MTNEWPRRALGELIRLQKGVSYKGEFLDQPGPRLLGLGTLVPGGGIKLDEARTYSGPIREDQRIKPGELLVALTDITQEGKVLGTPALVPEEGNGGLAVTHHVARVIINSPKELEARFLYYLLQGQDFKDYVRGVATGTTVRAVSVADVLSYDAELPPPAEQRAISRVLGALDDKIELNRRMNQTLEEICRALFKFWFVDFGPVRAKQEGRWKKGESLPGMPVDMWDLWPSEFEESEIGEIPKGWKVRPVSSIVEVNPERRLAKGEVARYVEMGQLSTSSARVGGWLDRAYTSGSRFQNGDVLVARITPCLENGKTAYVDFLKGSKIGWGSTELLVLSARKPLPPQWTYCLARTDHFRMHLVQNMTGTSGRQRAPAECLDSLVVAIPMNEITQRFGQFVTPWFEKFKANDEESSTLAGARDALLPKLLSGEIRVPVNGGK
jgi:type I restriction enzyme S subunit